MSFYTDQQTLDDLQIFGKPGGESIYSQFNRTRTAGGAGELEDLFRYPLSDAAAINRRVALIRWFGSARVEFPFRGELFDVIEQYLANTDERTQLAREEHGLERKIRRMLAPDATYVAVAGGVASVIELLQTLQRFLKSLEVSAGDHYVQEMKVMSDVMAEPDLEPLLKSRGKGRLAYGILAAYDRVIRWRQRDRLRRLLSVLYEMDVYIAVAGVAAERGFAFPVALPPGRVGVKWEGVYHPGLKRAVGNSLCMSSERNILFLTGANMAGKSTLMKTLAIALFLGHMGFPVPAKSLEFSVRDGIYTTINLADNLDQGVSHFYAEVCRVRDMARALSQGRKLFIVFDELFRGTNVKDAYEATVAVTEALAERDNCLFIVSTHIMEAGEVLRERCGTIGFRFLPTVMEGDRPVYTYVLEEGISEDRHGMVIIRNEGILELLKNGKRSGS